MSFIDLFAKGQHSSMHVQLTSAVQGESRQSCLSANIVANTLNSVVNVQYVDTFLQQRQMQKAPGQQWFWDSRSLRSDKLEM